MHGAKRRGVFLPGRLRTCARRGVTLVELLVSMLILTIVCIAWLQIIGIQSARKEARRREAVERLAGVMDAFMFMGREGKISGNSIGPDKYYEFECNVGTNINNLSFWEDTSKGVNQMFKSESGKNFSPIGYRLYVVRKSKLPKQQYFDDNWGSGKWLIGELYDSYGDGATSKAAFFALPVCLGF